MIQVEPLVHALYDPDHTTRQNAVRQLRALGPAAREPLTAVAQGQVQPPRVKRPTGLLNRGPDPSLLAAEARSQAVTLLGELTARETAETLAAIMLHDSDGGVRARAALALARWRDPRAVTPLLLALGHSDFEVRADAAEALGMLGDQRAVEPLLAMMQSDGQAAARWQAMRALGQLGDVRAVTALIAVLKRMLELPAGDWAPPDEAAFGEQRQLVWAACTAAVEALEKLGDARALPILEQLSREAPARTIGNRAWHAAETLRRRNGSA